MSSRLLSGPIARAQLTLLAFRVAASDSAPSLAAALRVRVEGAEVEAAEAARRLAAAPKPLHCAVTVRDGAIVAECRSLATAEEFAAHRLWVEITRAWSWVTVVRWLATRGRRVLCTGAGERLLLTVRDLDRWVAEYELPCGTAEDLKGSRWVVRLCPPVQARTEYRPL